MGQGAAITRLILVVALLLAQHLHASAAPPQTAEPATPQAVEFFEAKVRPRLVERRHKCHGAGPVKGGLSLTSRAGLLAGGDSGPAVVPGKPGESLLLAAVGYANDDLRMPPDGKLPADEIAVLVRWVQEGAAWSPDDSSAIGSGEAPNGMTPEQTSFWAFQPVSEPAPLWPGPTRTPGLAPMR